MGLIMNERKAVTAVMVARYCRASKKQKGRLLDELVALTGYNRWYAVGLLRGRRRSGQPGTGEDHRSCSQHGVLLGAHPNHHRPPGEPLVNVAHLIPDQPSLFVRPWSSP